MTLMLIFIINIYQYLMTKIYRVDLVIHYHNPYSVIKLVMPLLALEPQVAGGPACAIVVPDAMLIR